MVTVDTDVARQIWWFFVDSSFRFVKRSICKRDNLAPARTDCG